MRKKAGTLMVLGASYSQIPLIEAAKDLGYKTVVATMPGNYKGIEVADSVFYGDLRDPQVILQGARENSIDGIATCCMDTGVRALGYVSDQLNLKGLSEEAGLISSDKAKMKEAFNNFKVNTAKYKKISTLDELEKSLDELAFPIIIKAVDLQGSLGIYTAKNIEEAKSGFKKTMELTKENYCIVEEFIEGDEFGAQAFIYEGEIIYVLLHNDLTYQSATAIPIGHSMPFKGDAELSEKAIHQSKLAIEAIGLNNCAVNIDLIEKDGEVYIIELTGRIGATCLPDLVNTYYGIDVYKMIALAAMGESPKEFFESHKLQNQACYAEVLLSEEEGVVKDLVNSNIITENIVDISFNIEKGTKVKKFKNSSDRIGQVILRGQNLAECEEVLNIVKSNIYIDVK